MKTNSCWNVDALVVGPLVTDDGNDTSKGWITVKGDA